LGTLINKVGYDTAYVDAVAMREPVRVVDSGLVDQHAVATAEVTNSHAVRAGKYLSMPA
jgi:hypothetical protein